VNLLNIKELFSKSGVDKMCEVQEQSTVCEL